MKGINKHTRVLILMIASLLLLTLFVLQWLRSQYRGEKERLVNDLNEFYIDAQDEIVDTMLFRSYVSPVLRTERLGRNQRFITLDDTSVNGTGFVSDTTPVTGFVKWKGTKGNITVRVEHGPDSGVRLPDTVKIRKINDDMLLRSVRLIVSHSNDSSGGGLPEMADIALSPDSAVFKQHFSQKLEGAGMNFFLTWEEKKPASAHRHHKSELYLNPLNPFALPAISVTRFNGYLAGRIMPQVLSGLVLMIVTALAFRLSYRSIRENIVLNDLRNEFISNMTHELKTPVATLSVALESLAKYNMKDEPAVMEDYLKLASLETKRLEDLINRILDHSMLEQNGQSLNPVLTDINLLVQEVAGIMQQRLEKDGKLEFLPSDEKLTAMADPLFLKGVLVNLVDNSIKYCDKVPLISLVTRKEEGFAVIGVTDNGPGIPPEYQGKIFEKFFRLPTGNVHNVKGYGLGLSFALLVMKLHKGSIAVRNNDAGCSFTLKIPVT